MPFHVSSEAGRLRQIVVHRPQPRIAGDPRPGPPQCAAAAGTDRWHDTLARTLQDLGVTVHYLTDLLADVLEIPEARDLVLARTITAGTVDPALLAPLSRLVGGSDAVRLSRQLMDGVAYPELAAVCPSGQRRELLQRNGYALPPLPQLVFQRSSSAWIYGGVSITPAVGGLRRRAAAHLGAVYRFHPMFADSGVAVWYGDDDGHAPVSGHDIQVLGNGAVLVGIGAQTSTGGLQQLARRLFRDGGACRVVAVELPGGGPLGRLDGALAVVDHATVLVHPGLPAAARSWTVRPTPWRDGPDGLEVTGNDDLFDTLARVLGVPELAVLDPGSTGRGWARDPCQVAADVLTVDAGLVVSSERHEVTNALLREQGVSVVTVPGSGLQGLGPRSVVCPVERDGR